MAGQVVLQKLGALGGSLGPSKVLGKAGDGLVWVSLRVGEQPLIELVRLVVPACLLQETGELLAQPECLVRRWGIGWTLGRGDGALDGGHGVVRAPLALVQ